MEASSVPFTYAREQSAKSERSGITALGLLEKGLTAECLICGVAVLLVSGPALGLWCHRVRMRGCRGVRCSEPARSAADGLIAGAIYKDRVTSATLRCTRAGSGWPESRAGSLVPVHVGKFCQEPSGSETRR